MHKIFWDFTQLNYDITCFSGDSVDSAELPQTLQRVSSRLHAFYGRPTLKTRDFPPTHLEQVLKVLGPEARINGTNGLLI